jgi:O-antigen/teichoic acid export membrane protein
MTAAAIGAGIGLLVGAANYVLLAQLSERVEKDETKKVLKIVGLLDLVVLPLIGFLIGTYVFG